MRALELKTEKTEAPTKGADRASEQKPHAQKSGENLTTDHIVASVDAIAAKYPPLAATQPDDRIVRPFTPDKSTGKKGSPSMA